MTVLVSTSLVFQVPYNLAIATELPNLPVLKTP